VRKASVIHTPVSWIYLLSVLLGIVACWAALHHFYFVFAIPVILAIVIYSLYRTEKFILLVGAIAPLSVNINDIGAGLGIALPTEPLIMMVFIFLLFYFIYRGKIEKSLLQHPLTICVFVYLTWLWISSGFSTMGMVSFKYSLARTWFIVVFFIAAILIFRRMKNIHFFLKAISFCTLVLVIFTLTKHGTEGFVRSSSYSVSWPFFPDHGMYAAAIAFCVPILAFYTFNGRVFRFHYIWLPIVGFFLLVLLFGIVVSYTRATWLSLVAALGVFLLLRFKIKFSWIIAFLAVVSVYAVINQDKILYNLEANKQGSSDELEGHVKSVSNISTDPSNMERINRWKCAMRMVQKRPVFGYGPGTFVFNYGVFQQSNEMTIISTNSGDLGDAHSEYFSALAEMGIPGFALWITMVLITMGTAFKIIYKTNSRQVKITAMMVLLGLVTYYFHALLNNYSQYDKIAVPLWTFMAVIVALDIFYLKKESAIVAVK